MADIRHGTAAGYTKGKCRCDECKRAHREAAAKYAAANRERLNAKKREKYAEDPEKVLAISRAWRERNPERVKEYDRQKYLKHRDRIREYSRVYYFLHREAFIAKAAKWRKENPERAREIAAEARRRDPEKHNARSREANRRAREADPQKLRDRFNAWAQSPRGRAWFAANRARRRGVPFTEEAMAWIESLVDPLCTYCGKAADSIDHIVPVRLGGTSDRENLTPACMDCNRKKHAMSVEAFLKRIEAENA